MERSNGVLNVKEPSLEGTVKFPLKTHAPSVLEREVRDDGLPAPIVMAVKPPLAIIAQSRGQSPVRSVKAVRKFIVMTVKEAGVPIVRFATRAESEIAAIAREE